MNNIMACVAAIAALIAAPALAADMAVKAPPAPVYNWTGWYAGANVGGGWGHRDVSFAFPADNPILALILSPLSRSAQAASSAVCSSATIGNCNPIGFSASRPTSAGPV